MNIHKPNDLKVEVNIVKALAFGKGKRSSIVTMADNQELKPWDLTVALPVQSSARSIGFDVHNTETKNPKIKGER